MHLLPRKEHQDLVRIRYALYAAIRVLSAFPPGAVEAERKQTGDLVTEADRCVDLAVRETLASDDAGWLSEDTADDLSRLGKRRVWTVDPLDGTQEFLNGVPEWAVSVGLVEDGIAVAGGIVNPQTWDTVVGIAPEGVTLNDAPVCVTAAQSLEGARVLASRSEVGRGEWARFEEAPFSCVPTGSVAYKLALVAAGRADATFTLQPKNEWDIAAGVALVTAAGGRVLDLQGADLRFNERNTLRSGLVAGPPVLVDELIGYLRSVGAL